MAQDKDTEPTAYPTGRGYGHDYMRGGEVLGGYGYSNRPEYTRRRGDSDGTSSDDVDPREQDPGPSTRH